MLFFNFLCLLYLMVLSNSHTISKSIDTDDGIDEVSDTIVNLDNTRHRRIRRDKIHHKYRIREIPTRQAYVVTGADIHSKIDDGPYTQIITFNATAATTTYRSPKRKISGFWKRFRNKNKTTTNIKNVQKRHVIKRGKYAEYKDEDDKEYLYSSSAKRKKNFNSFLFQHPALVTTGDDLEVTVDVPLKKKHNNIKFVNTPYFMYATKLTPSTLALMNKTIDKKTTENMYTAIAKMSTQINHLKKIYGTKKSQTNADTQTTTYAYPRTADIEELLTGIKMKAIQTVVENEPSLVDMISNTVTEATFGAERLWNRVSTPFSRFLISTLHIDDIFNKDEYSGRHNLVTRSVTSEPLSISNIEEMLQKEIKNIYHKMKFKVSKDIMKYKPFTSTTTPTTTSTTTSTTTALPATNTTSSIVSTTTPKKPTTKCKTQKPKTSVSYPIKTSTKPPPLLSVPRLERDHTSTDANNTTKEAEAANSDDYSMLNLYEKMLHKVQEDNAMKLIATANLPTNIKKNERYRLSKRNPETLTDIELKETLYNDGIIIPDYEYLKPLPAPTTNRIDTKTYESQPSTSYEELSKKIAYDDFVNGYKHYLKFQQEKAKADNFSAMVKYQAHRHHKVDEIGKYILDKIPQLPPEPTVAEGKRLKRFFEDMDLEDQEVSTKTDDSWFRKNFYIFLDNGPPKKFHTSQIVALKSPIADITPDSLQSTNMIAYNQSSSLSNLYYGLESDERTSDVNKASTPPINLDELTKSLGSIKTSTTTVKNSELNEIGKVSQEVESTTIQDIVGLRTLRMESSDKSTRDKRRREVNEYTETKTELLNVTVTYTADRHKRANESIAEDFVTKDLEERSSTPAKEMQADVTLQSKNKSGSKFGFVDVNLVPTNSMNLHVNNTKGVKKSKLRDFFKKFHFKSMKSKKKEKRTCTYRQPRFNPFKSLKKIIFKPCQKTTNQPTQKLKTTTNLIKTKFNPLDDSILNKPIEKQKTTKLNKFMMDTSDVQIPESEFSNFNMSETLKSLPPIDTISSTPGKVPSLDHLPGRTGKPSTFLLMLDDGQKSVLYVQPKTVNKSTRNMRPPKRRTTRVKTISTKMKQKTTKDLSEVLSVNVKTLRTLPSIVMKALTSNTNETLPDLNLEIAKMQYGVPTTVPNPNDARRSTLKTQRMSYVPLAKPLIEGLTYTNQLTRMAKLTLPNSKRLEVRRNIEQNNDLQKSHDYFTSDEYVQEPVDKERYEATSSSNHTGINSKNVDYFNDLLMWNKDILDMDRVPPSQWSDLIKSVEGDLGRTEYTTPSLFTLMDELNQLDKELRKTNKQEVSSAKPTDFTTIESHNDDQELIRHVVLNDKAMVKSKDLLIKGEQKYFQYNRPNIMNNIRRLSPATMPLPMWSESKPFKQALNVWTADVNVTIESPFSWVGQKSATPKTPCKKPIVLDPDKHITFTSEKKTTVPTLTLHSPITWSSGSPETTKPPQDCLAKIARKFYIGSKPKDPPVVYRLLRSSSLIDHDSFLNNVKPIKVVKSAKSDLQDTSEKSSKSETSVKADKSEAFSKTNKFTDSSKDLSSKDTPALMVDTTLLSYDDEVETVTNGIDLKKMLRNSQKTAKLNKAKYKAMTRKPSVNVVAKTNKRPQMYYSTPLPMKPSDFNKFLKEQGMDVESLIAPVYGQTTLFHSWMPSQKPATIDFLKNSHATMLPSKSSTITKLNSFISKYTTQIDNFRHKPKDQVKIKGNKNKNLTPKKKLKDNSKNKFRVSANGSNKYKREIDPVIDYVLERPYSEWGASPIKRIKKFKLFRQKYYEIETLPTPKMESDTEEIFSPELQSKLSHLQETKYIGVPKTKPKTGPQMDFKFMPTVESQFLTTSDKKFDTEKLYALVAKTVTPERTTLVSTIEPTQDDSAIDTPLELSGSIIFTSEDSKNKDVDITIINFDDVKKNNNDFTFPTIKLPQKDKLEDSSVKFEYRHHKTSKLKEKNNKMKDISSKSEKQSEKYNTLDSSYRLTTKIKSNLDNMAQGRLLLDKKMKDAAKATVSPFTTYADELSLREPFSKENAKHHDVFNYFDKLRNNNAMLHPKRVQISSHYYKYDILYKNPDNSKPTQNRHQNQNVYSTQVMPPATRKSLRMKNTYNKAITPRDDYAQKILKRSNKENRRWVTIDTRFRYGRNVDVTYPESDKENEWNINIEKQIADMKNLEKRFGFDLHPKIQFIQDKLSLKRMTTSPKTEKTSKRTRATKTTTTIKDLKTTSEITPSLDDLFKPRNENETKISDGDKLTDSLEGFRIKFGNKKIIDAVQKIKAMSTEDTSDVQSYDMKYGVSSKFGFVRKNLNKDDDDFDILRGTSTDKENNYQDYGDRDITFRISTKTNPPYTKYNPAQLDYEEIIRDPEHAATNASENLASRKFEQSIFDKSMYGKKTFDESVFEKAIFGPHKYGKTLPKPTKNYSHMLTDIMSYDITPDNNEKADDFDYDESSLLPDHVNIDNPATVDSTSNNSNVTKKKNYIFDSASIIYNKSYLHHFGIPTGKLVLYASEKTDKTTVKPCLPVAGNTLSVLFRNPLEGHLGFGVKPMIQVKQPKPAEGVTLQVTPIPTPMEIMQARLSQNSGPPWSQGPIYPPNNNWPQIQAASLGLPPIQTGIRYNSSEAYGIYMEPGILNYDYSQPIAPVGRDRFYADLNYGRSEKKNAKQYFSTYFKTRDNTTPTNKILKTSFNSFKHYHSPKNPFNMYIKTYTKNKKPNLISRSTNMPKDHTVTIPTISTRIHPQSKHNYVKRDIPGQDTYTAKDVAALEVIVDLMKNTLSYEEKDIGSVLTSNVVHPMKFIHQPHDSTNSIQVHIAIPYDIQNSKKRSPLEPVRVRKVFSAKMSTPVDLEYQVHSFEGGPIESSTHISTTTTTTTSTTPTTTTDDGLSPGMYLLIDKPKNGYALKPVKTNIDFTELKSRQAGIMPVMELKGETTLQHDTIKNLAKVTLSKNFISAVNRQLVEMYENLTKTNDAHMRKRRNSAYTTEMMSRQVTEGLPNVNENYRFRRVIDWDAVKKYFGYERVCSCKCKANKPMCRACAASDAVVEELTFEFDNLAKYMQDHCTEIQTYFWVNPSGGLKLRNAVDRLDESLRDYYKRSKGKCHGRTCEALGNHIEKKRFVKNAKVTRQSIAENLLEDLVFIADDINKITDMKTCYNDKLQTAGLKMIESINYCISNKTFSKRSDAEAAKKKFVKNVYSLDNINVNIICNPEVSSSTESFETSSVQSVPTVGTITTQKLQEQTLITDNFLDFELDNFKNHTKRKGLRRLFLKRNNKDKLFTYYTIEDAKTPKIPFKREVDNQIEMPLVADGGGTFWLEYLNAATTSQTQMIKEPMTQNEPLLDIAVVQTNDIISNDNSVNVKTMKIMHDSVNAYPVEETMNKENNAESSKDHVPDNLSQLLNLFENLLENKKYNNYSVFSQKLEPKQTVIIKSMKPSTKKTFAITSNKTSATVINSLEKLRTFTRDRTRALHTTSTHKTTTPTIKSSSNRSWDKYSDIIAKDKAYLDTSLPVNKSTGTSPKASSKVSSDAKIPSNTSSDTALGVNLSSNTIAKGGETTFADTITSASNVSKTKSTASIEKQSTDAKQSETTSSDNILSDTLSDNIRDLEDISSDIMPSEAIIQDNLNKDNTNVSLDKLLENISLPNTPLDILQNSQHDAMAKVTMSLLYSLKDIEKQFCAVHSKFLLNSQSTTPVKAKYKSKPDSTVEKKRTKAPIRFLNKYFLTITGPEQADSTEADLLKTKVIKEPNEIDQQLTTETENNSAKTYTNTACATTKKTDKEKLQEKFTSPKTLMGLTNNFYLLKKTSPVIGRLDFIQDEITPPSMDSIASEFEDSSSHSTYGHPKVVIINEYDQVADTFLNQNERNSDKYRNLLLSIIQYETNRLNDEWQKIASANDNSYEHKRSATQAGSTPWKSTFQTTLLEKSVTETPQQPKKKGLLNKLVRKIGMKVVSAKKKVVHSSSSNYSISKTLTDGIATMIDLPHSDKTTAALSGLEEEATRLKPKNLTERVKQKKIIKTPEARHLYPSNRMVCDIQATFNHVTQRRQELSEKTFEAYVKDVPCYKYKRLQRSFLLTRKTRIPKWDWIRNKRSVLHLHKYRKEIERNTKNSNNQFCDKFEMFVKDDYGIYRIMDRKKRDTSRSLSKQLRRLPPLKPGKNELYMMVGDSVTLDCPLQPQRLTYSEYIWGADPKDLLNCDNVRVDGFTLVIRKVGPRNAGRYSCSVDGVVRKSTKVMVVALPTIDVVFLPTYKTPRDCNYDDLKAIQQLGREMSNAVGCGDVCSIRIDEPICQKDRATNRSLIRSTGVLTMSPHRFQCSVQCRRDLFSSMLRLAIANIPSITNARVVISKDGVNDTLKPSKYVGKPTTTHTLRKKDSSGHFEYHKFSSVAKPGLMDIVTLCDPGFYLLNDQNICAPCPANTSASRGANVCVACAAGTAASAGAAQCHRVVNRLRRYDWWLYPPCGYMLAFGGLVCACGVCMVLALVVHLGSKGIETRCPGDKISSVCLESTAAMKAQHAVTGYMHSSRVRPLSPSRVILARFFKPSLPSSRGTVVDSQETRFELWKEKNIPPSLPDIDFDIDTS